MTLIDVVVLALLVIAIAFTVLVLPIWIIGHYLTKAHGERGLAAQDEKLLADLWDAARRMEERMKNLERVFAPEPANIVTPRREVGRG